jgi:GxxExxY protein
MKKIENVVEMVIQESFFIHRKWGPGLLESAYEAILEYRLKKLGLKVERQKSVSINCEGIILAEAYRIDLFIEDILVVELKSIEQLNQVHPKQVLTYLRIMDLPLGLLINFGSALLKDGIKRVVNNYKK